MKRIDIANRLGISDLDMGILEAGDSQLATLLALSAINPFTTSDQWDPGTDISDIAKQRITELKGESNAFNRTVAQWQPDVDEVAIGPGWAIKDDDIFSRG